MTRKRKKTESPKKKVVQDFSDLDEVVEKDEWLLGIGGQWLKSWKPYLKTSDKSEAIILSKAVAESYLPKIKFYRHIVAKVIKA